MNNPEPKPSEENVPGFHYPVIEILRLSTFQFKEKIDFIELIQSRKSERQFVPLSLDKIGNILWLSSKVKDLVVQENGYILSHRPSASAGARHPIDIILSLPVSTGSRSLYYYNPFGHSLNRLGLNESSFAKFLNHVDQNMDCSSATIVWFVAHPLRTEAKYKNADSLLWRDAGALIHCLQLACIANEVSSCPLGTLGNPYISEMFEPFGDVEGVGGILIG